MYSSGIPSENRSILAVWGYGSRLVPRWLHECDHALQAVQVFSFVREQCDSHARWENTGGGVENAIPDLRRAGFIDSYPSG